jgi:colanic acid biosynthesis glycosyl transferase WcaI
MEGYRGIFGNEKPRHLRFRRRLRSSERRPFVENSYGVTNMPCIDFINAFVPVSPLYGDVLPMLSRMGYNARAFVIRGSYQERSEEALRLSKYLDFVPIPRAFNGKRLITYLVYSVFAVIRLVFWRRSFKVILTQPPLFYILASFVCRMMKSRYIIHVMDLYPELLQAEGCKRSFGVVDIIAAKLARTAYTNAEKVVVIGRCMGKRLLADGLEKTKIELITNWAGDDIVPVGKERNLFRKKHFRENSFIVMYSGNMGVAHEFATVIAAAKRLERCGVIVFAFVGTGSRRCEIERAVAHGSRNIKLFDYQPISIVSQSLSAASVHFISIKRGFEGLVVPSKLYGILAVGRPVLYEGERDGEVAKVLEEEGCGYVIDPLDTESLVERILYYFENRLALEGDGNKARKAFVERYSERVKSEEYVSFLSDLICKRS